jgi:phosphotransferase system enzyme I (PtsI)
MSEAKMRNPDGRRELGGVGIGRGSVVGPVARMAAPLPEPPETPSTRAGAEEIATARSALASVATDLRERAARSGGVVREVLEAQAMMAEDPSLVDIIESGVAAGRTAARAVFEAFLSYRDALAAAGPYLAARVADLDDVRQRVVAACLGVPVPGLPDPGHPYVLVAHDLAPADTAALDLDRVLGFVTAEGGPTSHTAVLARAMGIPAIVACSGADRLLDGTTILVDAARGLVVVEPSGPELEHLAAARAGRIAAPTGPGRTADGHAVALLANIGRPEEVAGAVAAGAEGVGLFRTEFLYLEARDAPDEASQVSSYQKVFEAFGGRRVVVRVLDAGADKPLAFLAQAAEPNPALGVRGLRALRAAPALLHTQLAAIATAAARTSAEVWVMAPMVAEPEEAAWFVTQVTEHGLATSGVMVEVPSAALLAEEILGVCSFVSLGTNDLAQYALAADRQVGGLAALQDPWHPALLRLVELVGAAGGRTGKPVGVCGEAAADPLLACVLVGLGVTSLSMAAPALADVRSELGEHGLDECRRLARLAVAASSAAQGRAAVEAAVGT